MHITISNNIINFEFVYNNTYGTTHGSQPPTAVILLLVVYWTSFRQIIMNALRYTAAEIIRVTQLIMLRRIVNWFRAISRREWSNAAYYIIDVLYYCANHRFVNVIAVRHLGEIGFSCIIIVIHTTYLLHNASST